MFCPPHTRNSTTLLTDCVFQEDFELELESLFHRCMNTCRCETNAIQFDAQQRFDTRFSPRISFCSSMSTSGFSSSRASSLSELAGRPSAFLAGKMDDVSQSNSSKAAAGCQLFSMSFRELTDFRLSASRFSRLGELSCRFPLCVPPLCTNRH